MHRLLSALVILLVAAVGYPCTVAVVAGSATPDGRPLLWKNRDANPGPNRLVYVAGDRHAFLGLANAADAAGEEIWAGVNDAGLAIMNSASYNLYTDEEFEDPDRRRDEEGVLMRRALATCASVDDFERLLEATAGDRGVEANFGVIDAHGGAAFFETRNERFVRFDATDPKVAPEGYILRTNYSFTGRPSAGAGYIRFDRASALFHRAVATGGIDLAWLLLDGSRDMVNGLTGDDPLARELPAHAGDARFMYASDTIVRNSAVATSVFVGVRPGEDPAGTAYWARLGHPLTGVALPQWLAARDALPLTGGGEVPPLAAFAERLRAQAFPLRGGTRDRYLNLAPVLNRQGDGVLPRLRALESEVLRTVAARLDGRAPTAEDAARLQREVEDMVRRRLLQSFPEEAAAAGL